MFDISNVSSQQHLYSSFSFYNEPTTTYRKPTWRDMVRVNAKTVEQLFVQNLNRNKQILKLTFKSSQSVISLYLAI